jgi:hypothetical protein
MKKKVRCYLGFHRWRKFRSEGSEGVYKECVDCGKFRDIPGPRERPYVGL